MALPAGLPAGFRGAGPVTIQVSPSTYLLMMKMIELGVKYYGPNNDDLQLEPAKAVTLQARLDSLYDVLAGGDAAIIAQLQALQKAGLTEAQEINKAASYELVLPS